MEVLYKIKERMQKESLEYIADNCSSVVKNNQKTLVALNVFYFIIVIGYLLASLTVFARWNVSHIYAAAAMIHGILLTLVLLRYGKKIRSYKEVSVMCMAFQLYAMTFAGIMSIVPLEMNQPAVYYLPIALGFVVAFTFTFYQSICLILVEMICYTVASFLAKSVEVFSIDLFSCILGVFLCIYVAKILYNHRARENESRQRIRRMGMMDRLTCTYNKASTEFLCKEFMREHRDTDCVMMILDFDNFKMVNDTYGHQAGDMVLRNFGRILRMASGTEHIAGRFGGDEFFLFLKKSTLEEGRKYAEEIMERTRMMEAPDGRCPFSCSIGIAERRMIQGKKESYDSMLARADKALYDVKRQGKNNFRIDS